MSDFTPELTDDHIAFVTKQPVFFVATAADGARINLSPKGMDSFRVLGPGRVAYLDVGGSGNETQAKKKKKKRITIMFCAFDLPPLILRIYGRGHAVLPQDAGWAELAGQFTLLPGTRQIFVIDVESVQTSCGWGVPLMTLQAERETLSKYHAQQDPDERMKKLGTRTKSIDGLPLRVQSHLPWQG